MLLLSLIFSGEKPVPPGSEPGELGELRGRLLFLLEISKHYQAETLLTHFQECTYLENRYTPGLCNGGFIWYSFSHPCRVQEVSAH